MGLSTQSKKTEREREEKRNGERKKERTLRDDFFRNRYFNFHSDENPATKTRTKLLSNKMPLT